MSDIQTSTVSEEGYTCKSQVGDYELTVDALGEDGPTAQQVLVADYASCYLPAFRVGGQKTGHDDLGQIQIDADADMDDNDDLTRISFAIHVEADLSGEEFDEIVDRANDICHVHDALKEELYADVEVHGGAF
jgi:organic hydroperoxide reductase OsmC/OhrA